MKNLKKVLALVMAFACAFTMFAGAAFTDQADISQAEAVDMLVALGVVEGYTNGEFRPDAVVTRAEMAKMIYIVRTGRSSADAYNNDNTTFTDITDHWARGYIKYCQSMGIIAGRSATTFDPNATVTTVETAKMLLVTLGYRAERAGLTGADWARNTTALADENGLFKNVSVGTNQGMPRQFAAQMIYNTIFAPSVMLRDGEYTKYGDNNSLNPTVGERYMDLVKVSAGILRSCEKTDGKETYRITTTGHTYVDENGDIVTEWTEFDKVPSDVSNLMGQRVKILLKRNDNDTDERVYGVYADEDSRVLAFSYAGGLETVSNDNDKIKLDGTEYKLDKKQAPNADGKDQKIVYECNKNTYATGLDTLAKVVDSVEGKTGANDGDNRTRNNAAAEIKLIDNDGNGKVDSVVLTPVKIGKVSAVTKTSVTINNGVGTVKFADDTIYSGIAKDDYVRFIHDSNVAEGGKHVEKLDVTNAKVAGERTGEARVDGTWYKLAVDGMEGSAFIAAKTNTTYDLVIVGNTILYAEETEGSIQNVAFIGGVNGMTNTGTGTATSDSIVGSDNVTVKVRMYFSDGSDAEVKIARIEGDKLVKADGHTKVGNLWGKLVTYTKMSDGNYDVKAVSDSNLAGCDDFYANGVHTDSTKNKSADISSTNGAYYDGKIYKTTLADDAVIFVRTGKEAKVLTGKQVKDWSKNIVAIGTFTSDFLTDATNGIDYVKAATLITSDAENVPGAKDFKYAYATTDEYKATLDGENKGAVDVWDGTGNVTLYVDTDSTGVSVKAGDLIRYKVNGKFIEEVGKGYLEAAVLGFDGKAKGELKVTQGTYTLDEDVIILTVDDKNSAGVEGAGLDSIVEAGYAANGTDRIPNIMYMLNEEEKVIAVVIDSENNELKK